MPQILSEIKLLDRLQSLMPTNEQASASNAHMAVKNLLLQLVQEVKDGQMHEEVPQTEEPKPLEEEPAT